MLLALLWKLLNHIVKSLQCIGWQVLLPLIVEGVKPQCNMCIVMDLGKFVFLLLKVTLTSFQSIFITSQI